MDLTGDRSQKVTPRHVRRQAYLYVRQSTLRQVVENTESTQRQYALRQRAVALGWPIEQVVVTNTVPVPEERHFDKLKTLSIAPLIAMALRAVFEESSVSEIFRGDNQL